ncbi:MAG: PilZ domain-containing protein [Rhodopseudomonas sp.]|nr:PilZ domain-containing protein [Rhodopseudomonas sp.]
MTTDLRKHPRRPGHDRPAVAYIAAESAPISCTVVDISEGGAGLTFVNTAIIPNTFKLEIEGENTLRTCRVIWKAEPHRIGVAFVSDSAR